MDPTQLPIAEAERCLAEADLMQHTHVQCDRPRNHTGNHHAMITGNDLHLASDGHTLRALAWQVEWRDDQSRSSEARRSAGHSVLLG